MTNNSSQYWIASNSINISLNAQGNPNLIQASVTNGTVIVCHITGLSDDASGHNTLDYDQSHNYRRWNIVASPTFLGSASIKYVYIAIPKDKLLDNGTYEVGEALLTFPSEVLDINGLNGEGEQIGNTDYYYINIGGKISATDESETGESTTLRTWLQSVDLGKLNTDEYLNGGDSVWYRYSAVDGVVTFIKQIIFDVASVIKASQLWFGTKSVTSIAVAEDAEDDSKSAVQIATPEFVSVFGNKHYLNKTGDTATGLIKFAAGADFGTFNKGVSGARISNDGAGEMKSLVLRESLTVPELIYNRVEVQAGNTWRTIGGGKIKSVTRTGSYTGIVTLKLEEGEVGAIDVGDICQGIFHMKNNNATSTTDDHHGNFTFAGFTTIYFRILSVSTRKDSFMYELRCVSDRTWTNVTHPQPEMSFAVYGNTGESEHASIRQSSCLETNQYKLLLVGIGVKDSKGLPTWTYGSSNIQFIEGLLDGFTIDYEYQNEITGQKVEGTKSLEGYGIAYGRAYVWGHVEEFYRSPTLVSQQMYALATNSSSAPSASDIDGHHDKKATKETPYLWACYKMTYTDSTTAYSDVWLAANFAADGTSVAIYGSYNTLDDLQDAYVNGDLNPSEGESVRGRGYIVQADGHMWVFVVDNITGTFYNDMQDVGQIKGDPGDNGADAYSCDLSNEMTSIPMTADGYAKNITTPSTVFTIYKGSTPQTLKSLNASCPNGVVAIKNIDTGRVAFTISKYRTYTNNQINITITGVTIDNVERSAVFTIQGVRDAENPVIYQLEPSDSAIKVAKNGSRVPASLTVDVSRTEGETTEILDELPNGYMIQFKVDDDENLYDVDIAEPIPEALTANKRIIFYLLNEEEVIIDKETVPVVADGANGDSPYVGDNGNWWVGSTDTGISATPDDPDVWTIGDDGYWYFNGEKTTNKAIGNNGQAVMVSYAFKRSSTTVADAPVGGSYDSPHPTTAGWSDGVPSGTDPVYMSQRCFTSDGKSPQQSVWSTPCLMADTADIDVEYSDTETEPGNPTDNPENWHNDATSDDIWMAIRSKTGGSWGSWQISKIKGEQGLSAYEVWLKQPGNEGKTEADYLESLIGASGKSVKKIVEYYALGNSTTPQTSWSQAMQIPNADKPYLWNKEISYADTAGTDKISETNGVIIGKYSADGKGIAGINEQYKAFATKQSSVTGEGSSDIPADFGQEKPYLYNREQIVYDDDTTGDWTEWQMISYYGKDGISGALPNLMSQTDSSKYGLGYWVNNGAPYAPYVSANKYGGMNIIRAYARNGARYDYDNGSEVKGIPVKFGCIYVYSVYIKTNYASPNYNVITLHVRTSRYNNSSYPNDYHVNNHFEIISAKTDARTENTDWKRVYICFKVGNSAYEDADNKEYFVTPYIWTSGDNTDVPDASLMSFCMPKLEESDFATPWCLSEDDKIGKSVVKVVEYYAINNDKDNPPTSGWSTSINQPTSSSPYLWNKETSYANEACTDAICTTDPVIIGYYSKDGKGIKAITEYYQVKATESAPSSTDKTGSQTIPADFGEEKPYLYNREKITYTQNGTDTDEWTSWQLISYYGKNGDNGADGVQPNLFGYDTVIGNQNNFRSLVHTPNGIAGYVNVEASTSQHWAIRINDICKTGSKYSFSCYVTSPVSGTLRVALNGTNIGADKVLTKNVRTLITGKCVAGSSEAFVRLQLTPDSSALENGVYRYAGLVKIENLKIEDATNLIGAYTAYNGLADDSVPQGQNLIIDSQFKNKDLWTIWHNSGKAVSNLFKGADGFEDQVSLATSNYIEILKQSLKSRLKTNTWYTLRYWAKFEGSVLNNIFMYSYVYPMDGGLGLTVDKSYTSYAWTTDELGYYISGAKGISNGYSIMKVTVKNPNASNKTLPIVIKGSSEANCDYLYIAKTAYTTKNALVNAINSGSTDVLAYYSGSSVDQTYELTVPKMENNTVTEMTFYIGYVKDGSTNSYEDQYHVRVGAILKNISIIDGANVNSSTDNALKVDTNVNVGTWQEHTITFKTPSVLNDDYYIIFRLVNNASASRTVKFSLCMPKLEENEKATEWQPNEQDRVGVMVRPCGEWKSNVSYVYDDNYRDIVIYGTDNDIHYYTVMWKGTTVKGVKPKGDPTSSSVWKQADEVEFTATNLLLAKMAYIENLGVNNLLVQDGTTVKGGFCGVDKNASGQSIGLGDWRLWLGSTSPTSAPFRVDKNGSVVMTDCVFSGLVKPKEIVITSSNYTQYTCESPFDNLMFDFSSLTGRVVLDSSLNALVSSGVLDLYIMLQPTADYLDNTLSIINNTSSAFAMTGPIVTSRGGNPSSLAIASGQTFFGRCIINKYGNTVSYAYLVEYLNTSHS